jgi:hypothetical protein
LPRLSADPPPPSSGKPAKKKSSSPPRQEDLAAALRENLRKRKAQAVARNVKPDTDTEA